MHVFDALSALKSIKERRQPQVIRHNDLCTVWGEMTNPDHASSEYPRPQFRRDNWICLDGLWDYAITGQKEHPQHRDGRILVPFSPECSRSGVGRNLNPGEFLWYFTSVTLSEIPKGKRLLLHFGAVDQYCTIWWNGKLVGNHQNGYLSFSFDVTEYLKDGVNTICVRVQDDTDSGFECRGKQSLNPRGMFYTAQSGIWQTVWMEWVPENRIEKLKITPLYDKGSVRFEITLTRPDNLMVVIDEGTDTYYHYIRKKEFSGDSKKISREIPLSVFRSWSPEDPWLYNVLILTSADKVQSYFAMRKFSVGKDSAGNPRLMLNNKPYFYHGVLDQGYWPESLYTPPGDDAMIYDIQKMKELGFNMIRKHLKIEPMRWYYHCDRLGMIVWQDMVNGGGKIFMPFSCYLPNFLPAVTTRVKDNNYFLFSRTNRKARKQWEKDCIAMIHQLYNCPCIGLWTPFNEGWGQFDSLRITRRIKKADHTRLVDHASGWYDQGGGDIKSVHNYFRPLKVHKDKRPFVLTEYGGYSCSIPGHVYSTRSYGYHTCQTPEDLTRAFHKLSKILKKLEKKGLSGAVYTQLSDIEEEINGLLTYDRKVTKIQK